MTSKKSNQADVHNKSAFFFSIGLFVTMTATLLVFEHKTPDDITDLFAARNSDNMEELVDVPPTEQLPPPPPPQQQPQVVEVPDEEKIEEEIQVNMDVESTEETKVEHIEVKQEKEEEEDVNQIFTIVEEVASPVGGMSAFYKYVNQIIKFPQKAKRAGVEGKVFCTFIVNRDGTIEDVKVLRGIGWGCDEEAVRVIQGAPAWKPAKQRGKAVRSRFHVYVQFLLE